MIQSRNGIWLRKKSLWLEMQRLVGRPALCEGFTDCRYVVVWFSQTRYFGLFDIVMRTGVVA